jgi:hypothetical protein
MDAPVANNIHVESWNRHMIFFILLRVSPINVIVLDLVICITKSRLVH